MKQLIQQFIVIITLLFAAAGCKKDDAVKVKPESELVQSVIASVNGPTSGTVNQKLTFSIIWQNPDGTSKFDHLQDSSASNIKMIRVFAVTNVIDSVAVKDAATVTYVFKAATPGDYYLKFYKPDNADKTAIIDTIHITK